MVVMLKGCSAIYVKSHHSSPREGNSAKRRRRSPVPCFFSDLSLASKRNAGGCGFMVGSPSQCAGCKRIRKQEVGFFFLSKRMDSIVGFFSIQSGLVCEEQVGLSTCRSEDHPLMDSCEQRQSPLVSLAIPDELFVEPRSCSSPSDSETVLPKLNLHYLEERDEEILSKRILSLSRSNKVRSAIELYASMVASGLRPKAHACNSLLSCLLRNEPLDDALRVFDMMRKEELVTGHTYSLILKTVASTRGFDAALEMFRALEDEEVSKKKFDVIVYNTMISVCAKAKNWFEAEEIWTKLKLNALTGTKITYDLLVSTFVQCGQTELALDAYHEMVQSGIEPGEDVMKAMISSCSKEGKWNSALSVLQKMLNSGIKPNIIAFNALINCLGKAGEYELAFRVFDLMKTSGHMPDTYTWTALLSSLYRSGRYGDALRLFEKIKMEEDSQLNSHLYNMALLSCQRLGLWECSLQLLWEMESSGVQISTASYNHVICACEAARKPQVALQVYRHMIHQKCTADTFTYLSLIRACVWGSLWTEVEKILEDVAPNASLYNALVHGFSLRGKSTLAKKLYEKMRSIGLKPDGKTSALMLQHFSSDRVKRHPRYFCRAKR